MAEHVLEAWANSFDAMADGRKPFDYRRDDRGFEVGDVIVYQRCTRQPYVDAQAPGRSLYRWMPERRAGAFVERRYRVTYIFRGQQGLGDGWCVLGLRPLESDAG